MDSDTRAVKVPKYLDGLCLSDDGQLALLGSNLASRHWDGLIAIYSDPRFAPEIPHIDCSTETEAGSSDVIWVNNKQLVVASDSGAIDVWGVLDDGKMMENSLSLAEHDNVCCSICLNDTHQQILSGSWDGRIKVWDLAVEMSVQTYNIHSDKVLSVAWNTTCPDLQASASEDGNVFVLDSRELKPARRIIADKASYPCVVSWNAGSSEKLALGFSNGKISLLDTRNPVQFITTYQAHSKIVNRMAFSKTRPNLLASVSDDTTLCVQDVTENNPLFKKKIHNDYIKGLAWDDKNNSCWTCAWDGKVIQSIMEKNKMEVDS
eukprot:gene7106-7909_t